MNRFASLFVAVFLAFSTSASADAPQITDVRVEKDGMGWRFFVTIEHPDSGWDHYADGWEVIDAAGNVIAHRKLHHPHVGEQPFTRSLGNVMVPDGMREVFVRARCSADGWTGGPVKVGVPY